MHEGHEQTKVVCRHGAEDYCAYCNGCDDDFGDGVYVKGQANSEF